MCALRLVPTSLVPDLHLVDTLHFGPDFVLLFWLII